MDSTDFLSFDPSISVDKRKPAFDRDNRVISSILVDSLPPWLSLSTHSTSSHYQRSDSSENISPFVRLHNEIISLSNYLIPNEREKSDRQRVISDLSKLVLSIWPEAQVHVFGSQMTNLLIPNSDIDITILNVPLKSDSNSDNVKALEYLASTIRNSNDNIISYLEVISNAKFPIIKLDHRITNISVDICINNNSGLDTGKLMKKYLRLYPMLRPLSITIKLYLSQRRLHETYGGGIGSFVLMNMILSFLQYRQRLFTHFHRLYQETWNLGVLLLDFFRYYSNTFNFITTGVSVSSGGLYNKKERGSEWFNTSKPLTLSVENPDPAIQPPVDIGKNSFMIGKIRRSFEHGAQVLLFALMQPSESILSYLSYIIRQDDPSLFHTASVFSSTSSSAFPTNLISTISNPIDSSDSIIDFSEPSQDNNSNHSNSSSSSSSSSSNTTATTTATTTTVTTKMNGSYNKVSTSTSENRNRNGSMRMSGTILSGPTSGKDYLKTKIASSKNIKKRSRKEIEEISHV